MVKGSDHHSLVVLARSLWACGSALLRTLSVGTVIRPTECGFELQAGGSDVIFRNR